MSTPSIRVGLIGVHPEKGWAAVAHIPALQHLAAFRIEAVSHHDPEVARAAAAKFGAPHALSSSAELVNHPNVDLVVVTVKVPRHRELVSLAIDAGKAVLSEWPLGVSLTEARALRDLARAKAVRTSIGLQTRASPPFMHMRELIQAGYVGKVLSATVIGSGIIWGESMSDAYAYTLDPANGATMLTVQVAHSLDGLLHALGVRCELVSGQLFNARKTITSIETGAVLPLTVPDQIMVAGRLTNGAALSAHFRGGLSRGTNFHVEVNGTRGDLIVTGPVGYVGFGGNKLMGAQDGEALHQLEVPEDDTPYAGLDDPAKSLAAAYAHLASDIQHGTHLGPDFDDAVDLHHLIDTIERSEGVPRAV